MAISQVIRSHRPNWAALKDMPEQAGQLSTAHPVPGPFSFLEVGQKKACVVSSRTCFPRCVSSRARADYEVFFPSHLSLLAPVGG